MTRIVSATSPLASIQGDRKPESRNGSTRIRKFDAAVGMRIRAARQARRISQEKLAEALGLSFQQVQKYEKGINRVSAGRLVEIAHALNTTLEALTENLADQAVFPPTPEQLFLSSKEGADILHAMMRISNPMLRRRVIQIARDLSGSDENVA